MAFPAILKFDRLAKAQTEANELFQGALLNERAQSWNKMIDKYKRMLKLIAKPSLPSSFIPPATYSMLMYESYYHLGVALQHLGRHKDSIPAYTNAILSMSLRKNGCTAGCNSNSCFHTPILAKRAFAYAKSGDMKSAFRDIEKAVVLDTHNPDLYCVRALLWNTSKEQQKALEDLNRALTFNKSHTCALLLRGVVDQPIQLTFGLLEGISPNVKKEVPADHKLATKINPDAYAFLDIVADVHWPKIIKFWNRFLWSLNVPRTEMHVDLTSSVIAQYNNTISMVEHNAIASPSVMRPSTAMVTPQRFKVTSPSPELERPSSNPLPFRCGTPQESTPAVPQFQRNRRLSYGEALRTYTSRKQDTGVSEYVQRLVAHASKPPTGRASRISSAAKQPFSTSPHSPTPSGVPRISVTRSPSTAPPGARQVSASEDRNTLSPNFFPTASRRSSHHSIASCPPIVNRKKSIIAVNARLPPSGWRRASVGGPLYGHKQAAAYASSMHGLEVFSSVNVSDAPRMYYKPWGGDKLPVAEKPARQKLEAFRV